MFDLTRTIALMKEAHRGQVDKGGKPYYRHPLRVMLRLGEEATDVERVAALLHDVVEDTGLNLEALRKRGYTEEVVEVVRLVSENHFPGLTYLQHIKALVQLGNMAAIRVKLADIADNLAPSRVAALPEHSLYLVGRYEKAKDILINALGQEESRTIVWGEIDDLLAATDY